MFTNILFTYKLSIYRLHWQVNFDYTFRFTPTTLSDSLQIHSFVHSAYTSKLTLTTSLCLLRLQLLVHSDLAILEPFFSITPVDRFWLVKTYQYGWHPSVLSHHALGTAKCDESYCIEGTIFGRSFVGVRGFFYHESYCDESGIMTIYGFLNIQIFGTSVPVLQPNTSKTLFGPANFSVLI
jgi:hypothetical protein